MGKRQQIRGNNSVIISDQQEEFVKHIQEQKLPGSHFITFLRIKLVSQKCNANIYLENALNICEMQFCKRHRTVVRIRS